MRYCFRTGLLFFALILSNAVWSRQAQTAQLSTAAPQDAQAVSILNKVLNASGGLAAVRTVLDYTATGNVIYHWNPEEQGSLTIQAAHLDQVRFDAVMPSGTYSEAIHDGQTSTKDSIGHLWQYPPSHSVSSAEAFQYQPPLLPGGVVLPQSQIAFVLSNPRFRISYMAMTQVDGVSLEDIRVQLVIPKAIQADNTSEYRTIDFFIDAMTNQVVIVQDNMPKHVIHQVRYANYTRVSGMLVPFSISEYVSGQSTREIQLNQISFNAGLPDTAFILQ